MKRILAAVVMVACAATLAGAQEETVTLKGTLVDNLCAAAHQQDIADFVKTHPKSCAVMPDCAASGYSIVADGKVMKLDTASNAAIAAYLAQEENTLDVVAVVKPAGDGYTLISIEKPQAEGAASGE